MYRYGDKITFLPEKSNPDYDYKGDNKNGTFMILSEDKVFTSECCNEAAIEDDYGTYCCPKCGAVGVYA